MLVSNEGEVISSFPCLLWKGHGKITNKETFKLFLIFLSGLGKKGRTFCVWLTRCLNARKSLGRLKTRANWGHWVVCLCLSVFCCTLFCCGNTCSFFILRFVFADWRGDGWNCMVSEVILYFLVSSCLFGVSGHLEGVFFKVYILRSFSLLSLAEKHWLLRVKVISFLPYRG